MKAWSEQSKHSKNGINHVVSNKMKVSQLVPSIRYEVEKPFEEKLRRAKELVHVFGGLAKGKACVSCSFGKDSMVVLWLCIQEFPDIAVVFNNTGVQFSETYEFKKQVANKWNLNLIETKPEKSFWEVADKRGLQDGSKKGHNACCYYLKDKPNKLLMKEQGLTHAFTGLTVLESRMRMFTACQKGQAYYVYRYGFWKIHPIMFWTPKEVWDFMARVQISPNPAYEKYGLERLGCVPCTSHKFWRKQMAKTNPKMYRFIQERYFHQKLLEV